MNGDEDDEEKEAMTLEVDVERDVTIEAAQNLYEDVRICIEFPARPKIVE